MPLKILFYNSQILTSRKTRIKTFMCRLLSNLFIITQILTSKKTRIKSVRNMTTSERSSRIIPNLLKAAGCSAGY